MSAFDILLLVVGYLLGCYLGERLLPSRWLEKLRWPFRRHQWHYFSLDPPQELVPTKKRVCQICGQTQYFDVDGWCVRFGQKQTAFCKP